jgi:uncharacterized protein (DUF1499 family)
MNMSVRILFVILGSIFAMGLAACFASFAPESHATGSSPFKPCPGSPNCVSSLAPEGKHYIEPLQYSTPPDKAYQQLIHILKMDRMAHNIIEESDRIQVEFTSGILKFVDDVTFFFPADQPVIHMRSASRSGYYDFGANRRRLERLRQNFAASAPP